MTEKKGKKHIEMEGRGKGGRKKTEGRKNDVANEIKKKGYEGRKEEKNKTNIGRDK